MARIEIQSYRDLAVWKKSMDAAVQVYQLSRLFPSDERFGLISQIRRSASSIPANIAEGHGRLHQGDYLRFLSIARGSLMETETHLELALRLEYINQSQLASIQRLLQEVGRLLNGLIRSLRNTGVRETGADYMASSWDSGEDLTPDP
ncbi:MAG TPA: four helix bundle protein [Herpetosiphonaceae bacterium]